MRGAVYRSVTLALLLVVAASGAAVPVTASGGDVEVTVSPSTQRVASDGTVTYGVTVEDLQSGVGSYDINVSIGNDSTATIVNVSNEIGGTSQSQVDAGSARLVAAAGDTVDEGDALVATVTVRGQDAGNTTLSVEPRYVGSEDAGERYTVTAVHNASLVVEGDQSPETELELNPPGRGINAGDSVTYDVTTDSVRGGVGAYDLAVSLDDTSTARIVEVTDETGGAAQTTVDAGSARLFVTGGETVDRGDDVVIATVTVVGERAGDAELSVEPKNLTTEDGAEYRITGTDGAMLDVVETVSTVGASDAPPVDPDHDGVHEDVNGNGRVTPGDATVLYSAIQSGDPAVVAHPEMYDVNDDGRISRADALALFQQALAE